jgi:transcriptional regulator with XRE-family HTH domain
MDKENNTFGKLLRAARKKNGLSQRDVANRAGQNVRSIQKIENGEREPRVFLAVRLAVAAGMEPGEFFTALAGEMKDAE